MITDRPLRASPTRSSHLPMLLLDDRTTVSGAAVGDSHRAPAVDARATGVFGELRGRSAPMLELYEHVRLVARTDATVLIEGETGTGKEVVARTIHDLSPRRGGAFVALNCGAVSASLIESELFGHEQGSFTGAMRRHSGVFAQANEGTLFLDEITEMPMDLQVKLLRVLETGTFHRVGGEKEVQTDARIIAAANRPPEQAVRDERLREDLFYRLRVFPLSLPPLRCRGDDVDLLARHFLDLLNFAAGTAKRFTPPALSALRAHGWPGNVRDLKNCVQRAFILAEGDIGAELLPSPAPASGSKDFIQVPMGSSIAAAEQRLIMATLASLNGNKLAAAKVLGISLKTLYGRLNVYAAAASC